MKNTDDEVLPAVLVIFRGDVPLDHVEAVSSRIRAQGEVLMVVPQITNVAEARH